MAQDSKKNETRETIRTVVIAVLLAMIFRSLVFEPFHIPSGSMKSNLLIGDYLFVSKYSYGYSRYSFPFGPPIFEGRIGSSHRPQRGDVALFKKPSDTSTTLIKRVIGLPGDTVQMQHGVLFINGKPIPKTYRDDFQEFDEETRTQVRVPRYEETLPEGKKILVLDAQEEGIADNTMLYTVPPGHYFMMGDNRDNSADSRFLDNVGYVPEENLIGRAELILFSLEGASLRWNRFFTWIR